MAIRTSVLSKEPRCKTCLAQGRLTIAEEVDHIVPLDEGGSNDWGNLQGLCEPCHKAKTSGRPTVGKDGWPIL